MKKYASLDKLFRSSLLAVLITVSMLAGLSACAAASDTLSVMPGQYVALARARDIILQAAGHYRDGETVADTAIPGTSADESSSATRLDALAMISRAFGEMPTPKGDFLRAADEMPEYTDVPGWAVEDIGKLALARVLTAPEDHLLRGGESMPAEELDRVLSRIFSLYGNRLQDDFYTAINKQWLDDSFVPEGGVMNSSFDALGVKTEAEEAAIFESILSGNWAKGTPERKIVDMYRADIDISARDKAGADPIKPYIDRLLEATSMQELEDALVYVSQNLGINPVFDADINPDEYDKTKYSVYLKVPSSPDFKPDLNSDESMAERAKVETLFRLAGYGKADEYADIIMRSRVDLYSIAEQYREENPAPISGEDENRGGGMVMMFYRLKAEPLTRREIDELFPYISMDNLLAAAGFVSEPVWYSAYTGSALQIWSRYYGPENLESLKVEAAYSLLNVCAGQLSSDFIAAASLFELEEIESVATSTVQFIAKNLVGRTYIDRNFTAESKRDVQEMVRQFIDIYRGRIANLSWMSAQTKATALRKLDTMEVKAGYPDDWHDPLDIADIRSPEDGGSAFLNDVAYRLASRKIKAAMQGKPVDRSIWEDRVTEVNAFYRPDQNEIVLPAAILQPPFYTPGGRPEQNLAGVGWVIGHEITHAFDNNGALFDEFGNEADWWTPEDFEVFGRLCAAVETHYDGYEVAPGIVMEGGETLGENIADLGGISCALQAASNLTDTDYELFFSSAAKLWKVTMERDSLETQVESDLHSPSKARANKTLQTLDAFYDTFNIQPGDGMYVAPEDRVKIW